MLKKYLTSNEGHKIPLSEYIISFRELDDVICNAEDYAFPCTRGENYIVKRVSEQISHFESFDEESYAFQACTRDFGDLEFYIVEMPGREGAVRLQLLIEIDLFDQKIYLREEVSSQTDINWLMQLLIEFVQDINDIYSDDIEWDW